MNDDVRLERRFSHTLHEVAPAHAPDRLRTSITAETERVRPRSRWLALIKEPPMRTNSRLAVGSPTARVAAIMIATLLTALLVVSAGVAGARLFAADSPIVVDQSGQGHYTSITAAVAAAVDGDTILVRPGTYVEAVVIDKDLTLVGDGHVDDIIITAPEGGPSWPLWAEVINADPYALLVVDADATISGLTFEGMASEVILDGGAPTLTDSVFTNVGRAFDGIDLSPNGSSIVVTNGGAATVSANQVRGGGPIAIFGDANVTISANTLTGGPHLYLSDYGTATIVERNTIEDTIREAIGSFDRTGAVAIRDNVLANPGQNGINLSQGSADIIGNHITGAGSAGISTGLERVNIIGNTLVDNELGIRAAQREGSIADNVVRGGTNGIAVGTALEVSGNDVEGVAGRGIDIGFGSPVLRGNRSCGNGEANLFVAEAATPDIDDSNEFCEDALAATTE